MRSRNSGRWPAEALRLIEETDWEDDGALVVIYTCAALKGLLSCPNRRWGALGGHLPKFASEVGWLLLEELEKDDTPEEAAEVLESTCLAVLEGVCGHPQALKRSPEEIVAAVIKQTREALLVMARDISGDDDDDDDDELDDDDDELDDDELEEDSAS